MLSSQHICDQNPGLETNEGPESVTKFSIGRSSDHVDVDVTMLVVCAGVSANDGALSGDGSRYQQQGVSALCGNIAHIPPINVSSTIMGGRK